jgi:ferredoxin, 2Fe-2S
MKIELPQLNKTFDAPQGENVFHFLRAQQVAVASSCKGDGICGKCVVQVPKGLENLSPATDLELKLREKYNLRADQRLTCQSRILGDVELRTTYW